jgi:hypothetical protein
MDAQALWTTTATHTAVANNDAGRFIRLARVGACFAAGGGGAPAVLIRSSTIGKLFSSCRTEAAKVSQQSDERRGVNDVVVRQTTTDFRIRQA